MNEFEKIERGAAAFQGNMLVNVSGGVGSCVAWQRCIEWYGADRVTAVFCDTRTESEETYKFLEDVERQLGALTVLWTNRDTWEISAGGLDSDRSNGADIRDVFFKHRMTKTPKGGCKASMILKRLPLDKFFIAGDYQGQAVGFMPDEIDRVLRLNEAKEACFAAAGGGEIIYPCICRPGISRCDAITEVESWGIRVPKSYKDGFDHNNCLRLGCILMGNEQWVGFLETHPDRYAEAEDWSEKFREETGFAMCKDRRGGVTKPLTLVQIREEVASGERFEETWRSTCGCMTQGKLFLSDYDNVVLKEIKKR